MPPIDIEIPGEILKKEDELRSPFHRLRRNLRVFSSIFLIVREGLKLSVILHRKSVGRKIFPLLGLHLTWYLSPIFFLIDFILIIMRSSHHRE